MAVGCNNVVLTWLVRDGAVDQPGEEEEGDEEKDEIGCALMVRRVREQEEDEGEDRGEGGESLPTADLRFADHRWVECIAIT